MAPVACRTISAAESVAIRSPCLSMGLPRNPMKEREGSLGSRRQAGCETAHTGARICDPRRGGRIERTCRLHCGISAFEPKRTFVSALEMSAGGVKRTWRTPYCVASFCQALKKVVVRPRVEECVRRRKKKLSQLKRSERRRKRDDVRAVHRRIGGVSYALSIKFTRRAQRDLDHAHPYDNRQIGEYRHLLPHGWVWIDYV